MGVSLPYHLQKMKEEKIYDVSVIGGGLAGLTISILLVRKGFSVILFEKEKYPFHKVCGEYISMESWHFLEAEIGLSLKDLHVSEINKLTVTASSGNKLVADLSLGGFGISRYKLDNCLKEICLREGVTLLEECKAEDVVFKNDNFSIKTNSGNFKSKVCCGSWGKRSNIDVKWKRPFISRNSERLNNYVGIKYHVTGNFPEDVIALHNFQNGYCGLSKIEDNKYCLCYFMKASNLKKCGNSIERTEQEILSRNPYLKKVFADCTKLNDAPLSISQVSLSKKKAVEDHVIMLGDAAGMISPLCGNGMSIAMHSSKIASVFINAFLREKISRKKMEELYAEKRKDVFGKRITAGRLVQYLFGQTKTMNLFVNIMKRYPGILKKIINLTHGKSF